MEAPNEKLAIRALPKPLLAAIEHIFEQNLKDCALVGGTCLAGYYAAHRKSDDIDLFVKSELAFSATVLAVRSLSKIGTTFSNESSSKQFYHVSCELKAHPFTVDVVLDENLFRVGRVIPLKNGVVVVDLETLLKMKASTLVSRCAEKDLYDLIWLFEKFPETTASTLIQLGSEIDGGMNAENILASLLGTTVREEACGFAIDRTRKAVFDDIKLFKKNLIAQFELYLKKLPTPKLGVLAHKLKKTLE